MLAIAVALSGLTMAAIDASAQSHRRCDAYARDYANRATRTGENVVGGAVVGGIIGSVTRSWGRGAAIGSGVGAVAGAGKSSGDWNRNYR
ncbi:glycine zipper domain-containing protein [Breoghania sp.]|uniref:glycine zipper domain-containing protein n=1 Tax=Breoghania sp. TaxID=2065378 RepID=UPI002616631E|nr:glycine zipper domain-containing protein [Breoghania sp.]MDJ0931213.1 glycine zipper domain-containing protein [Breoghania sp.]